ncbi:molybdopterin-dependent oxidoreductase [Adlercreutzia sp. ZJ304]|uniref:molybdopterin-dependent oxidoreductase n=1 Tax=Adlercreutzia sp. ZJ304 TaxID=2709791 RepID=UPI0013EADDDD|nr:molybdopterin-dependent oxidoreductase [Adlercreutzia sp. ZJ304]
MDIDLSKPYVSGTQDDYVVRSCAWSPPGDHPVGCGVKLHVKDGMLIDVEGDEAHPISQGRLCVRCLDLPEYVHNPQRIIYPMRRVGERGENKWERITWDEAIDEIYEKTKALQEKYGKQTVVVFAGTGREATLYYCPLAFAVFGTPNACFAMSGFACYGPRRSIAYYLFGTGYPEVDFAGYFADRYDHPGYEVPKYIICWGKQPLYSNPDGFPGFSIIDMMKRGSKIISIDPQVTWLAAHSEYHVQLRPGTDAALALAMLNIIINEDLYDHDFVENWCYGFEDLRERVQEYTPERVANICWIDEQLIYDVTYAYAKNHPSAIQWGLAFDQTSTGGQAGQAVLSLMAITGNLDVPGGQTLGPRTVFLGKWRFDTAQYLDEGMFDQVRIGQKYPGFLNAMSTAQPDELLKTLETDEPYPLRMGFFQSSNFLTATCNVAPQRWYKALQKLEFNVVTDLFMTPTAVALADIFLPLASHAEHVGVVTPHFGRNLHFMGAMNKALQVGECKSDIEVCITLGKRFNPDAWPWDTAEEFFDEQLKLAFPFGLDKLQHDITYSPDLTYKKYETGGLRSDGKPGFETTTGKCELKSTIYPLFGEDPLPFYKEPHYSPYSQPELAEEYPLILTTGGRKLTSFHSEHRQLETLREIDMYPVVSINTETAAAHGIQDGDWVCIENMFGHAIEKARVTPLIPERIVHASHGWWYPEQEGAEPNLFGNWKSNINTLLPNSCVSALGFGSIHKDMICKIYRVDSLDEFGPTGGLFEEGRWLYPEYGEEHLNG